MPLLLRRPRPFVLAAASSIAVPRESAAASIDNVVTTNVSASDTASAGTGRASAVPRIAVVPPLAPLWRLRRAAVLPPLPLPPGGAAATDPTSVCSTGRKQRWQLWWQASVAL